MLKEIELHAYFEITQLTW